MNYSGQHVLVLGLGESGLAMALWLARCGATLRVADTRNAPDRLSQLKLAVPDVEFVSVSDGVFNAQLLDGITFVAVSPGLSPLRELKEIISAAAAAEIPVWSEIELFAQALTALRQPVETTQTEAVQTEAAGTGATETEAAETESTKVEAAATYTPKIIAITGTNGKTTVTSLTGLLCQRAGLTTKVAGNISPTALDVLRTCLDENTLPQVWVLELSSFQLHTTVSLQADTATILNITQDHLDWHGEMADYVADKGRIFGKDTIRILNRDDATVMTFSNANSITFGIDAPEDADCFGLYNENGMQWLAVAEAIESEDGEKKRKKKNQIEEVLPVVIKRLMPADALKIRGQHNATNALAALALCRAIDLPFAALLHGLRDYQGEAHRVELITTIAGVEYYDDSKGTNVGATVAALNGLGRGPDGTASANRLVLIAGGDGKGQDFTPLAEPLAHYGRALILIGRDADAIRHAVSNELSAANIEIVACDTLEAAVQRAAEYAHAGDAVLLSPACASLDMFRNYAHRAEVFVDAVRELALARGEIS
ncbi:UDP-N-acetylmuramoyl-L-alanine--D-glutamate ligase [Glaciimonas soli]|uniref:UDP-N-acetylmuramoylalanine--D-glutamate ligase n=1 Tax=Glaciimonas soli TaxID=2590999 RepID=A0A843YYK0_9BURK|nr:UDP-N-acetylmuramoyl-L-alanine--D-glutamate ligase [Glaciimonas soli]MQR02262.1 UDP-N-acetylmuramoyl-L-alanine--D-glutamate ligase [Glaciimonas soli]